MPCLGRIPFLLTKRHGITGISSPGVNALSRANPISTCCVVSVNDLNSFVSMPCLGRIPFLRSTGTRKRGCSAGCQCPVSGESHFYSVDEVQEVVVNLCQCPVSGESHFYWNQKAPHV